MSNGSAAPLRLAGSARERQDALAQLAATRPAALLLLVHAPSSPDRGTARFLREAARQAGRTALWALADDGQTPAESAGCLRWQRWLESEGFQALAILPSAQAATEWIADGAPHSAVADVSTEPAAPRALKP